MNCNLNLDWKAFAAIGFGLCGIILAAKMKSEDSADSFNHLVDGSSKKLIDHKDHE